MERQRQVRKVVLSAAVRIILTTVGSENIRAVESEKDDESETKDDSSKPGKDDDES